MKGGGAHTSVPAPQPSVASVQVLCARVIRMPSSVALLKLSHVYAIMYNFCDETLAIDSGTSLANIDVVDLWSTDMSLAHLEAHTKDKVTMLAGPELVNFKTIN